MKGSHGFFRIASSDDNVATLSKHFAHNFPHENLVVNHHDRARKTSGRQGSKAELYTQDIVVTAKKLFPYRRWDHGITSIALRLHSGCHAGIPWRRLARRLGDGAYTQNNGT